MFSGRLWMDSYWEPKPTPCARRWGEVPHARQVGQAPLGPKRAGQAWCASCGHVRHVRQVCRVLQPRQVRHVRGTRRVRQVPPRT